MQRNIQNLLEIDYLVFSAHKSATQSVKFSLIQSGFKALHCHNLENINLEEGEFLDFLKRYQIKNGHKLKVISTFREPIARMISSFFQWHGIGAVRTAEGVNVEQSLIYGATMEKLNVEFEKFCSTIDGFGESIISLCRELHIDLVDLDFTKVKMRGYIELEYCELNLFRFDLLVTHFVEQLETVCKCQISQIKKNLGKDKWYSVQYAEFKNAMRMPEAQIQRIYQSRSQLIDLFYPNKSKDLLDANIRQYGY